jgi:hypothetical protein
MKNITVQSHFKKVTAKESANFGQKRPNLVWEFAGLEVTDIRNMDDVELEQVITLVNDRLEQYGKSLLLKNGDDWNYSPANDVSLETCYKDITAETTRKRTVTKETLAKCGEFYAAYAKLINKSQAQANAGSVVIANKLSPIAGKPDALNKLAENVVELIEAVAIEGETNIKAAEDLEANANCLEWIVKECEKLANDNVNLADAL